MQLVPNSNLADPNICTICEEPPFGDQVVDTERFTPFNPTFPLNGRKYVCERCAGEIANKLGYESSDAVAKHRAIAEQAQTELGNVRQRIGELADHIKEFAVSAAGADPKASAKALKAVTAEATPASAALKA